MGFWSPPRCLKEASKDLRKVRNNWTWAGNPNANKGVELQKGVFSVPVQGHLLQKCLFCVEIRREFPAIVAYGKGVANHSEFFSGSPAGRSTPNEGSRRDFWRPETHKFN